MYNVYPNAFGANLVNDASASTLATYEPQLTTAVARGDILMGHTDYWQDNDPTLLAIYRSAGVAAPPPMMPTVVWPPPSSIAYGTALSATQLDAQASVVGTFTYLPALGTILRAGINTLTATFTPTNTIAYKLANASVNVTVSKAQIDLSWSTPAALAYGTALSGEQLNATANVPGSFVFSPEVGTVLEMGTHTLAATFTPTDSEDFETAKAEVDLIVTEAPAAFGPIRHGPVLPRPAQEMSRLSHLRRASRFQGRRR